MAAETPAPPPDPRTLTETPADHPGRRLSPRYVAISRVLAEMGEAGPQGLASDTIREDMLWLDTAKRQIEALQARWLAEDHRRHVGRATGRCRLGCARR
jgi:hypothetical protein